MRVRRVMGHGGGAEKKVRVHELCSTVTYMKKRKKIYDTVCRLTSSSFLC
jgi:hypothetical protein